MTAVRHAIIGAGFGGGVHLPTFTGIPRVEVIAVADCGSGRAKQLVRPGLAIYSDWRRMLDELSPDSVSVAVPPVAQREIVFSVIDRGIHVLCEKPFGMNLADAEEMLRLAETAGITAAVCFQYRFESGMQILRQHILSGCLGRLRRIDINWVTSGRADPTRPWSWQHNARSGGGVINAFLSHAADLMCWLSSCKAIRVAAHTAVLVQSRPDSSGTPREVTAEDAVDALFELDSSVLSSIHITNCQWGGDGMHIEIHGENGLLRYAHRPPFAGEVELRFFGKGTDIESIDVPRPVIEGYDSRFVSLRQLAQLFVAAIGGSPTPDLPTFRNGVQIQRMLAAVRRSAVSRVFVSV